MAAYTFRAVGSFASNTAALTPTMPAGATDGDLLLLLTTNRVDDATLADPAGWTYLTGADSGANGSPELKLYGRIFVAGDVAPSPDWSGATAGTAQIAAFFGDVYTDLATIIAHGPTTDVSTSTAGPVLGALTIATANTLVLAIGTKQKTVTSDGSTFSALSGFTELGQSNAAGTRVNTVWNYVQQTTAANIGASTWTIAGNTENLVRRSLVVALKTNPVLAPTFTAGPTVTATSAVGNTVSYTPNLGGDTDVDAYLGAYVKGSSTPSAANVKAGAGTGFVALFSELGVTAADTLTSTGLDFPVHDYHLVLENAAGLSAVSSVTTVAKNAASGKQYVTADVPWGAGEESILEGASPAAVDGDIIEIDTLSSDGYALTCDADGVVLINTLGDASRQSFAARFYDLSAGGWSNAPAVTFYVNNQAPTLVDPIGVFIYPVNEAISAFDLRALAQDAEGDALTATIPTTPPTGLSVVSSSLSGTPTVQGASIETLRWTDLAGDTLDESVTFIVGQVTVPDVDDPGTVQATATEALTAAYLVYTLVYAYSATIPVGEVIRQSPSAGTAVDPYSTVIVTVSLGERPIVLLTSRPAMLLREFLLGEA